MFKVFRSFIGQFRRKNYLLSAELHSGVPARVEKKDLHTKSNNRTIRSAIAGWVRRFFS